MPSTPFSGVRNSWLSDASCSALICARLGRRSERGRAGLGMTPEGLAADDFTGGQAAPGPATNARGQAVNRGPDARQSRRNAQGVVYWHFRIEVRFEGVMTAV